MLARGKRRAALCLLAAAVAAAPLTGCGKEPEKRPAAAPVAAEASAEPTASESPSASSSPSASPSAGASPSPSASTKAPTAAPSSAKSAAKPVVAAPAPTAKPGPLPPPPPPIAPHTPPLQSSCKPGYEGANEPRTAVDSALAAAAGQTRTLYLSKGGTDRLPPLPANLVRAIAWQESGWQSAIRACDGGIGTMQIMPATVSWMNDKYGTKSDPATLAGNVQLGTQLLDWLVAYFGDYYFAGDYNLAPDPATGRTPPLLDMVIAGYNAGAGNVKYTAVTDQTTGAVSGSVQIPNPGYVANVKALMGQKPWTAPTG
ncbi:lytic transglycosylase domain-containing protein [Kitasatospora camelliae]|uniref:Lytic transglycosylase domain-containing protein n=1 Tax=Kitasatospora camelliae TaxID=3156397 RepID=A0AAU8JU31_9ACTN